MSDRRLCNDVNPFGGDNADRNSAHAFRMRGQHIFQNVPRKRSVNSGPVFFRWLIGAMAVMAFLSFIGFQIWRTVSSPTLALENPTEGMITTQPEITVLGRTEPEVLVEINGRQVFSQPDGTFAQQVELQNGPNQIIVRAEKKHGPFTTLSRTIMLKSPEGVTSPVSLSPSPVPAHPLN